MRTKYLIRNHVDSVIISYFTALRGLFKFVLMKLYVELCAGV